MSYLPVPQRGDMTPWGEVWSASTVIEGVYWAYTPSHGGLMIDLRLAETSLTPEARALGVMCGPWLTYEEDCAVAIPFFEHPEWNSNKRLTSAAYIREYYPEYFYAMRLS